MNIASVTVRLDHRTNGFITLLGLMFEKAPKIQEVRTIVIYFEFRLAFVLVVFTSVLFAPHRVNNGL